MGVSTDGILVYGYNLGGDEGGWEVAEAGEYGEWEPTWLDEEDPDTVGDAERVLLASVGFTEDDWRVDGYFDRKKEAEGRLGVELESYCSGDYPMYLLAAHKIVVKRGYVKTVDFAELDRLRVEQDWDGKLQQALAALGVTPKQTEPAWLLASYWG